MEDDFDDDFDDDDGEQLENVDEGVEADIVFENEIEDETDLMLRGHFGQEHQKFGDKEEIKEEEEVFDEDFGDVEDE